MAALGKLSAGLAHELNNPAAAAARAAGQLTEALECMQTSVIELNKKGLDAATWDFLNKWLSGFLTKERETLNLSPLEKCDLDEDLQKWLISNDIKDT